MEFLYDGICLKNGRATNMDSILLSKRQILDKNAMLAVVCDGVGSMSDGAYASVESVRLLNKWFSNLSDVGRPGLRLRDEVLSINARIAEYANERSLQTATTLSALLLIEGQLYIVHAGDSRIYSIGTNGLQLLTVDAVTTSGQLTTYIGRYADMELYYMEQTVMSNAFLLCSDGLYKRVHVEECLQNNNIDVSNSKTINMTLNSLAELAIERGERDNISIAIVTIK
ncbi:MAG: serine/threonine-protein phosphatase [Oscillospiraceae bacterium]|nr:serine/threonine-protein phosphatase [Oscillospiraceae bacterium]